MSLSFALLFLSSFPFAFSPSSFVSNEATTHGFVISFFDNRRGNRPRYSFIVARYYLPNRWVYDRYDNDSLTTWICGFLLSFLFFSFSPPFSSGNIDSVDRAGLVLILFTGRLIKVVYPPLKEVGRYYDLIGCVLSRLLVRF